MTTWKAFTTTAIGIGLLMQGAMSGQQKAASAKPMTLTTMDYIEIRQLASRYAFAVDTGNNNGYDYADLFSADGEFMRPYAKGRDQLATLARGGRLGPFNIVHYITNHVIEPTPDGAIGKQYLIELNWEPNRDQGGRGQAGRGQGTAEQQPPVRQNPDGLGPNRWDLVGTRRAGELARVGGHYEDVYVKTADGWRFKKRDFVPSKSGPEPAPPPPPRVREAAQPVATPPPPTKFVEPTKQSTLTAMDYLQIQQLISSYGHALDSGYGKGENGEAYADLYTRDATFGNNVGRDRLIKVARIEPRGPDYVRHYLFNHVIEPTPEGVKGKEYLIVIDVGENGKPSTFYLGGHYEETYVKTADGWRMKTRRLFPPRSGPQPANAPAASPAPPATPQPAQASGATDAKRSTLTAEDYMAIQQLSARAAYALDGATDRGQAFAKLFAPDGVFRAKLSQPYEIKGREQLASFAMGDLLHRGPAYVRDYTTNHLIFPSAEGATGKMYLIWIEVGENGNPGVLQGGGRYEDVYVKTGEGWRIKSRTYVPAKLGAREAWEYSPAN